MSGQVTHFEIYGEEPTSLAEFYRTVFGWQVEQMPGILPFFGFKEGVPLT